MSNGKNPLQENLQWIVPLCVILGLVWVVSTYQRGAQDREKQKIRDDGLKATQGERQPFEAMLREIPQLVSSIRQGRWNTLEETNLGSLPRPAMPCVVVDVTDAPQVWVPWCSWPARVRARTIADVKSVILVERQKAKDQVYPYQRGSAYMEKKGYRTDIRLWVIDWQGRQILSGAAVRGQPLPKTVEITKFDFSNSDVIGDPPDLAKWLAP